MDLDRNTHETLDPVERDAMAAAKLAAMLEHYELPLLSFPAETGDVIRALQGLGYRVDADYVLGLLKEGIPPVPMAAGRRSWSAFNCWHLMAVLESRRRWTLHRGHIHKLTALELMALENEAAGKPAMHDMDQFSVEQLVLLMEGSNNATIRHGMRIALMAKLREAGAL